jgi:hypothetical protein
MHHVNVHMHICTQVHVFLASTPRTRLVLSRTCLQDEGALEIETEGSRQLFDYPAIPDIALQINGHREAAAGLLVLGDADRCSAPNMVPCLFPNLW